MKKVYPMGIEAYEFEDLSERVQNKVVGDHIEFLVEIMQDDEELAARFEDEIEEMERLQTPWFLGSIIYENRKDEMIEEIKANEYYFDRDGVLLPITHFVSGGEIVRSKFQVTPSTEVDIELVSV